jgi:PIF1-like helicase
MLQNVRLLIIDECSMAPVHAYNVADKVFRRIRNAMQFDDPKFGGLTVLLGGDFRQLAPLPGEKELLRDVALIFSDLLQMAEKLALINNMRTDPTELNFARLLKEIGEGRQECNPALPPMSFMVPKEWVIESGVMKDLLDWCFEKQYSVNGADCAILTHTNQNCTMINHQVLSAAL